MLSIVVLSTGVCGQVGTRTRTGCCIGKEGKTWGRWLYTGLVGFLANSCIQDHGPSSMQDDCGPPGMQDRRPSGMLERTVAMHALHAGLPAGYANAVHYTGNHPAVIAYHIIIHMQLTTLIHHVAMRQPVLFFFNLSSTHQPHLAGPLQLPLFSSHTPATFSLTYLLRPTSQLTTCYFWPGRPLCICQGAFSHTDLTTIVYQLYKALRIPLVVATSMTECNTLPAPSLHIYVNPTSGNIKQTQQQQYVKDERLVYLRNQSFPHVAEYTIILRTTLQANLPTFYPSITSLLAAAGGVPFDTSTSSSVWPTEAWTYKIAKSLFPIKYGLCGHFITFSPKRTHLYNL